MSDTVRRQKRYANVPELFILDHRLSDRAKVLWMRLDRFAGDRGAAFPLRSTLADELACSVPSVARSLKELEDAGWLKRKRVAAGGSSVYTLMDEPSKAAAQEIQTAVEARAEARKRGQQDALDGDGQIERERTHAVSVNGSPETASSQVSEGGRITGDSTPPQITSDLTSDHQ